MVSREDHCLSDLLWRWRSGELECELTAVISNHPDHADQVAAVGLPFHHVPVDAAGKEAAERAAAGAARRRPRPAGPGPLHADPLPRTSCASSARRRSTSTTASCPPSSAPTPTASAHERGVKLIGATAHYVTAELDAGPIIDQDVTRVSHRDEVADLVRIGRDIERLVLARAVAAHLDDRVLLDGARTVVF